MREVIQIIRNLKNDKGAIEAVLSVMHSFDCLTQKHGKLGPQLALAEEALQQDWGYVMKGRTMHENTVKMLDQHQVEENRHDRQTGVEIDRDDIDVW